MVMPPARQPPSVPGLLGNEVVEERPRQADGLRSGRVRSWVAFDHHMIPPMLVGKVQFSRSATLDHFLMSRRSAMPCILVLPSNMAVVAFLLQRKSIMPQVCA